MTGHQTNIDAAPADSLPEGFGLLCDRCSTGFLRAGRISTAFWQGDELVVLRNIPAMVCLDCGEEYVDDTTVVRLDRLRGQRFAGLPAVDQVLVPILDFGGSG